MKYKTTNDYTDLPVKIECSNCSFDAKLEAKEDTKGDIIYQYKCSYNKCLKITKPEEAHK